MKNFIVLSLTAILFLATFFEVDSSSSSESSSESSPESSSETSSKSSTSSSEKDILHRAISKLRVAQKKLPKVTKIGNSLSVDFTNCAKSSSRSSQTGKLPKVTLNGTSLYVDYTDSAEPSSGETPRRQNLRKVVTRKGPSIFTYYTDRAESSSRRSPKGKGPVVGRTLEEVKAEMKKLYKELAFGRKILQNNMERIGFGITEALARKNVERLEQKIIALRPELREARGMQYPEDAKQTQRELTKEIELLKAAIKENDAELKALEEKSDDTGERYSKLKEEQEENRAVLEDIMQANHHHGFNIYHYQYPELVDNDIVKLPFKLP